MKIMEDIKIKAIELFKKYFGEMPYTISITEWQDKDFQIIVHGTTPDKIVKRVVVLPNSLSRKIRVEQTNILYEE